MNVSAEPKGIARLFSRSHLREDYERISRSGLTIERSSQIGGWQFMASAIGAAIMFAVTPATRLGDAGMPLAYLLCAATMALGVWWQHWEITPRLHLFGIYAALLGIAFGSWLTAGAAPFPILLVLSSQHWVVHPPRRLVPILVLAMAVTLAPLLYGRAHAAPLPYEFVLAPTLLFTAGGLLYLMSTIYRNELAFRDLTEAARREAEAAQAVAVRLTEVDELKDSFVATVSHELRTPLTSIRGYLEALLENEGGELTADQREFCEIAYRNGERLNALIGDLLTVSGIDSGMLDLKPEKIDAGEVLKAVATEMGAGLERVQLEITIATEAPVRVDRRRLVQALTNLLSNAAKYSPNRSVVEARVRELDDAVAIEVIDQGVGIPASEIPLLGERFFRASTAGATPGTGLGLAITKRLLELQGGRLEVESELGAGSTFRIVLPRAPMAIVSQTSRQS